MWAFLKESICSLKQKLKNSPKFGPSHSPESEKEIKEKVYFFLIKREEKHGGVPIHSL